MNQAQANTIFEAYYQKKIALAGAVLPEEKLAVLEAMSRELNENGVIPISDDQVAEFNPKHPVYQAILAGEVVNVSGEAIGKKRGGAAGASTGVKIAMLAGIFLIPLIVVLAIMFSGGEAEPVEEEIVLGMVGVKAEPTATATPAPTSTPVPTLAPVVVILAATPDPNDANIEGVKGSVAPAQGDPASIEFASRSFILATGETKNGVWRPRGAEWLIGTTVRRVIAIPQEEDFENILIGLSENGFTDERIHIRLRSGEVVIYRIDEIGWYRRDQIEVLTSAMPSVVVVLSQDNDADEKRLVISGTIVTN
jgi:hypothetical protein